MCLCQGTRQLAPALRAGRLLAHRVCLACSLTLCGVMALAGAAIQPPSLAESGFLAEALGQPSQHRQGAASSQFCDEQADSLHWCLLGSRPLVRSVRLWQRVCV